MANIFLYIWLFCMIFSPYIICMILSAIIIFFIKKVAGKNVSSKSLIYIIILCMLIGCSLCHNLSAKPDKAYSEMKKINNSERLIGLTKNEVIALLGEPQNEDTENLYTYDAGTLTNYLFLGERDFYDLYVWFNENDTVKSTSIDKKRGG